MQHAHLAVAEPLPVLTHRHALDAGQRRTEHREGTRPGGVGRGRFGSPIVFQRVRLNGVHLQRCPPRMERHSERRLRHPVRADDRGVREAEGSAGPKESTCGPDVDRLRPVERESQAGQVEIARPGEYPGRQRIGEIRCGSDGAAILADQLRPQQRLGQEVGRGDRYQLDSPAHRQSQESDHAHVVEQRKPGDHDVVLGAQPGRRAHGLDIRPEVAVGDLDGLRRGRRAGGQLEQRRVRVPAVNPGRLRRHAGLQFRDGNDANSGVWPAETQTR